MRGLQGLEENQQNFRNQFPNGPRIIPTPSNGLLCGLEAIRLSIRRQYSHFPSMTVDDLLGCFQEHLSDDETLDLTLTAGYQFNNLSEDQIAAVLHIWGARYGLNLYLRYVQGNIAPCMRLRAVVVPDIEGVDRQFV